MINFTKFSIELYYKTALFQRQTERLNCNRATAFYFETLGRHSAWVNRVFEAFKLNQIGCVDSELIGTALELLLT